MFLPFTGFLFDPRRVSSPAAVTCPPYDLIDAEARLRYLSASEHNVVRLLLAPPGAGTYQDAAEALRRWRAEGLLLPDSSPRYYLYEMRYRGPAGEPRTARGLLGALELRPLGDRVLPHEETMARVEDDRLEALTATAANVDPIVALTPAEELSDLLRPPGLPRIEFEAEGVVHALYDVPATEPAVTGAVARHPVAIADGHHRYATALRYRDRRREAEGPGPWDSILAFLAPVTGGGLSIGPFHRLFDRLDEPRDGLESSFTVSSHPPRPPDRPGDLVLVHAGESRLLRPRPDRLADLPVPWRRASSAVARELLYPLLGLSEDDAAYSHSEEDILGRLGRSTDSAALLTAPVPASAVVEAMEEGIRFPQKSTFFHPKPWAGLVVRILE